MIFVGALLNGRLLSGLPPYIYQTEQKCDDKIVQLRREMRYIKYNTDSEASETLTELDTDNGLFVKPGKRHMGLSLARRVQLILPVSAVWVLAGSSASS